MVASLIPRKGHDVLLKAFSQAFRNKDVKLRIAGSGYEGANLMELQRQINELGIQNQVEVLGLIPQKELLDLIQNCHALVSSSYTETFGVSGIEALACGKPVVATRSGGPEFYVTERNGLLTPPGDVEAFAAAMQQMVNTYDQYQPILIRNECLAQFGEEAIVKRLEEIYGSLT